MLQVFELLSHVFENPPLPGFSRDNWKSNMRKYARVHPEYATMEPWSGRETADITYADCEGVLTRHLIDKGYLSENIWADKKPDYLIEVKTTTISCETPFFMSKAQYQRVRFPQQGTRWTSGLIEVIDEGQHPLSREHGNDLCRLPSL
jgi:hypothetical protein